ncbi:MAG: hypothetical protein VW268_01945 [Rhodospirillaceae bacterium]
MSEARLGQKAREGPFVEQTWEFKDPQLWELLEYWQANRSGRPRPKWRNIKLPDLYRLAPQMTIKDAIDGGRDFMNRFWGTAMTD